MNDSFSVLFLASWYPTEDYPTHGIFIKNHAKALSHYCSVIVMYVSSSDKIKDVTLEHTQSHNFNEYILTFPKSKIPVLSSIIHFFKYFYYYYVLSKLVKKHDNNIHFIQVNVPYPVGIFLPVIKKVLNIKHHTVFEQWTGYLKEDNLYKGLFRKFITQKNIQNSLQTWCLCEHQKKSMIENHLHSNYEILGNVVNTNIFLPKQKNNPAKKFIHISTLDDRQKNISGIINVFSEIEREGYKFELIVIGGKEEYTRKAKDIAQKAGIKNIIFTGMVEQEKLPEYYQSADALVMFSNYETFCVVVYEALSCGTYVITTNAAGLDKIISNELGSVVPPKNEDQLKRAIIEVLENKTSCNTERAHRLIKNNFSEEVIGKKLYDYYASLPSKK